MTTIGSKSLAAFDRTSFAVKVIWICLGTTLTVLMLSCAALLWEDWRNDRIDWAADQIRLGRMVAAKAARGDALGLAAAQGAVEADEDTSFAVWRPEAGPATVLTQSEAPRADVSAHGVRAPSNDLIADELVTRAPGYAGGRRTGELVMVSHAAELDAMLARNSLFAVVVTAGGMLLAGLAALSLTRRSLRPLYALDRGIDTLRRSHDFSGRVPIRSQDEFGRLTGKFNALLADLQAYDQRQAENVRALTEARNAAEEASVLKSQFLANMSHEIRTPLNGVLGMAQALAADALSAAQRERVAVIRSSGEALLTVLNDLLDLSKIEAGKLELEETAFDLGQVVRGARAAFAALAEQKGVGLALAISPAADGLYSGDPARLRQVLNNLISNAIKFTETGEARIEVTRTDGVLRLAVSDTGVGIDPEVLPNLFSKFTQADASTTRRFGGTGLGLAICRELAELMGGTIAARSEPGRGSTFTLSLGLPRLGDAPGGEAEDAAPPAEPAAAGLRVLAAEDNKVNQLVLQALLRQAGIEPVLVDDGEQALAAWEAQPWDLVLMDVQMPRVDGLAAARAIREREAAAGRPRTPIIALTANAMAHQIAAYDAAGMDGHVAKPIDAAKLFAALDAALEGAADSRAA